MHRSRGDLHTPTKLAMRWRRVRAVLAGALVLGVGATLTHAAWTDQELASTTVTAGTFNIVSRTSAADAFASHGAGNAVTMQLNASNLYPGQSRAGFVQIKNIGSVPANVALSQVNVVMPTQANLHMALRDATRVGIVRTTNTNDTPPTCTTATTPTATSESLNLVPALTQPTVTLQPNSVATYCFIVTLKADAPNAAQGGQATPTWTFTATTPTT